jgi:hypothetical protein
MMMEHNTKASLTFIILSPVKCTEGILDPPVAFIVNQVSPVVQFPRRDTSMIGADVTEIK